MKKSLVKSILIGIIIGALIFFAPMVFLVLLIFGVLMKIFGRRRYAKKYKERRFAFTDKIRGMTDDEYSSFKEKMESYCHC